MKICPKCATENSDNAKFCDECGNELQIAKTETTDFTSDAGPVQDIQNEDVTLKESAEDSTIEEMTAVQEPEAEQTEKKEEASLKKSRLIIGIIAVALICIIGFITTRPRLKSLEVTYTGDTSEGVVLDDDNEGFEVTAVYSNGKKEDVPAGEWQITESQTLVADSSSDVIVTYNGIKEDVHIECSTTILQYLTATYNGSTYEGTEINSNSDITVTGHFKKDGYTQEFSEGWYLDPETVTLKAGETSKITVKINGSNGITYSTGLEITGIENALKSIDAEYKGSTYAGTVIDQKSDIEVEGKYADGKWRDIDKEDWSLDPESVTLEDGKTSKIQVTVKQDNGKTVSTDLEIKGKEKPFTRPEIEGEHYNCSIDQFVSYINKNTTFSLFPMDDITVVGDDYKAYGMIPPKGAELEDGEALVLAVRENTDGKLSNIVVWSTDKITGMAASLRLAQIFDSSINSDDKSAIASFLLSQVYEGDDMIIYVEEASDHYTTYLMSRDFYDNNVKQ